VSLTVADAEPSLFPVAAAVTARDGGRGAVREITDMIVDNHLRPLDS